MLVSKHNEWISSLKVCFFDIEVSDLEANNGAYILCWSIKPLGGKVLHDVITKEEILRGVYDRRIVSSCIKNLKEFDVVVGYYSTKFDVPYLRTRAIYHGIDFFSFREKYHLDIYYTIRNKFKLGRSSLEQACELFGISGKTKLDFSLWRKARIGNRDALRNVDYHCQKDVEILEKLFLEVEKFVKYRKNPL